MTRTGYQGTRVDGQEPGRFAFGLRYWDLDRGGAAARAHLSRS